MSINNLEDFISGRAINEDSCLKSILLEIDQRPDCILLVCNIMERKVLYISPLIEEKIGYTPGEFLAKGPDFFYQIYDESSKVGVPQRQIIYTMQAKSPGFDPREIIIQEYRVVINTKSGGKADFTCFGAMLTYTQSADFEFVAALITDDDDEHNVEACKGLLRKLKKRHNGIYRHLPFLEVSRPLELVHVTTAKLHEMVTSRELEVLKLLSQGFLTKEIALRMGITFHTVETHRRRLLHKFEARNVAELIKKVSKVYWLE